jgi:hypothetical protein
MSRPKKRVFKISSRPCNGVDERGLALHAAAAADAGFRVKAATQTQPDESRSIVVEVDPAVASLLAAGNLTNLRARASAGGLLALAPAPWSGRSDCSNQLHAG